MSISWNQLSAPSFRESNDLLKSGNVQQQDAIKGLIDMVKGVETDTKNRNYAALLDYTNSAKSAEQLQSNEYRQGYQNLLNSFGGVIDAEKAAKLNDERLGVLNKFALDAQQLRSNDQTYQHNAVMNPITEQSSQFTLDRNKTVAQQKDALGTALSYLSQGKEVEAKALMGSLGENASTLFNTLNTVNQQNQQQQNWVKDYKLREDGNNRANNAESREAENHTLSLPGKRLGASIATEQEDDFYVKNPQANNPTYSSDVQKFITPSSLASLKTYQPHLESQSQRTGLPVELLTGVFGTETAFGLRKDKSSAGAVGAMQIMPDTGKDAGYGVSPLKDGSDAESFRFGADYLKAMIGNFNGDVEKGVAAYNAGAGRVQQAINQAKKSGGDWKQYLPSETQTYVSRVGNIQNYFKTGNDGSKLNIDPTINVPTYNAPSGVKFSDTALGQLNTAVSAINNYDAKLVGDRRKAMSDTTVNPDTWLKDNNGTFNGLGKTLYGLLKGQYSNGKTGEIIKGANDLTPAQQVQALEQAKLASGLGDSEAFITDKNLASLKTALQNAVSTIGKGDADASTAFMAATVDNAIRTVTAQNPRMSPQQALQAMNLSDDMLRRYIQTKTPQQGSQPVPKGGGEVLAQYANQTQSRELQVWVKKMKASGWDKIPSIRTSVQGRAASSAGLW